MSLWDRGSHFADSFLYSFKSVALKEIRKVVQLRPCLMHDYGCRLKAKTHLFCPNHWVQIHLDDREALDNPMHKRCATWGVDAATGQVGYCPDPAKHRAIAVQVVEALAKKEEAARIQDMKTCGDLQNLDMLTPGAAREYLSEPREVACTSCGVVNIKSATANSCGACGKNLIPIQLYEIEGIIEIAPELDREIRITVPDAPKEEWHCHNCLAVWYPPPPIKWCLTCDCCVMCGHPQGYPVPEHAARCGQCGRGN